DRTDDRASDFQSRWNCDGLLWFREYEQHRRSDQVQRLVRRIKSGHLSVPMTMLVSCYGGTPTEGVIRGLYLGGLTERRHGLRLDMAVSMENQTLPWGLGMLWAGSGVRYSWKGICGCASKVRGNGGNREHDVYWWVGPDGSRVLMKWYSLAPSLKDGAYANEGPGGYAEARHPREAIEYVCTNEDFLRKNPHQVLGLFGQGWDDLQTQVRLPEQKRSFPVVAKELSSASRRVIVSNESDYFRDLEKTHGDELPEQGVAFGNEWELYSASMAEVSASVKRATEKLRTAEAMAATVLKHQGKCVAITDELMPLREQCWTAFGLYWEHDWTADGPVSRQQRADWQRKIAGQIVAYVDALHDRSKHALSKLISTSDALATIVVFNSLGWVRTDVAKIPLDEIGLTVDEARQTMVVCHGESKQVASELLIDDEENRIQFLAEDVPSNGLAIYEVRHHDLPRPEVDSRWSDGVLRTAVQSIRVHPDGSLSQWNHSEHQRPLVDNDSKINQWSEKTVSGIAGLLSEGEVSTTVGVEIQAPTRRRVRITIYEAIERIEIHNAIDENFDEVRDWSYRFALSSPDTFHEEVGAITTAKTKSAGGDYADRNARTNWLTLNHFTSMWDGNTCITLSNWDCLFFHLGDDLTAAMDSTSSRWRVLAGGQVDGPDLGIPAQGGDEQFTQRFAINVSSTGSPVESMKRSLEFQNPFVAIPAAAHAQGTAVPIHDSESLFEFASDSVLIWAVKPGEDRFEWDDSDAEQDNGVVVRLWNVSDRPSSFRLRADWLESVTEVTHVETDLASKRVENHVLVDEIMPGGMRTYRLLGSAQEQSNESTVID
ncbi:MAG: hypothetical protein AAF989_14980, partial [Planctomycetota bacterium]